MRFGLQKLGRFASGRLQGSKGVQKYDKFMEKSPVVRGLLTAGDIAGATLGGAALLGGGLSGAGIKAGLGKIGSAAKASAGGVKSLLTGKTPVKQAAGEALKFARTNKDIIGGAVKGAQMMMPDAADEAAMMNAETARKRYDLEQEETLEERRRKENIAKLLMPMYQQLYSSRG